MAMNIGSSGGEDEVVSTINTTPLVDVMLVLLIIFLITIPVVTQSIAMTLPKETNIARQTKPENIEISVNKDGDVFWNVQPVADNDALFAAAEEGRGDEPAARGAHPRRREGALRIGRAGRVRVPARGHPEDQLRHRTAAARAEDRRPWQ